MAMNREQKRSLAKRGEVGDDAASDDGAGASPAARTRTAAPKEKEERTSPREFVREVRAELRKVAWPTRSETLNYSLVVALTLVLLTALIFSLDWVFSELVLRLFNAK